MDKQAKKMNRKSRPAAYVVRRCATATGGEELVVRTETGHTKRVTTSPSSVASMDRAVKLYSRALKSLADK